MPTETRYMRSDQHTVNGLTAYKLGLEQTTTSVVVTVSSDAPAWGIRVWKRSASGVETEITSGEPVAIVVRTATGGGIQSNTWSCPETSLNPTDAIVVRVYIFDGAVWVLAATFITEQLNASKLNAATWTVYYYTYYSTYLLRASFYFGTSTYNSRIENFTWSPPAGVPYTVEVSDSGVVAEVLGKGVGVVKADSFLGFDVGVKDLVTCVSDSGVAVDFSARDCLKFLVDVGVGFDWFSKDVAPCLLDTSMSLDILLRGVGKSLADFGLVSDWKCFDLLSCVLDVWKGLDWVPFGVPHVVELRDVFGVYELFNLPPLILDLNRVLDRVDAYVKVGVQTWLYLWDRALVTDYTYPWDVGRVKEFVVAIGWVLRDYPLTEWELKRNERIASYLSVHKVFRLSDFQRFVWFEQIRMQEQRAFGSFSKQMFYYRSRYIKNFCNFLFMVLEEKGMVRKIGLDSYVVVEAPSVELINEISRRRWFDIWSFC